MKSQCELTKECLEWKFSQLGMSVAKYLIDRILNIVHLLSVVLYVASSLCTFSHSWHIGSSYENFNPKKKHMQLGLPPPLKNYTRLKCGNSYVQQWVWFFNTNSLLSINKWHLMQLTFVSLKIHPTEIRGICGSNIS